MDQCPLFTSRHIHHSGVWILQGYSVPKFCLACATEQLEDRSQVSLYYQRILEEFQALLTAKNKSLLNLLSSDKRVLDHFSIVVHGRYTAGGYVLLTVWKLVYTILRMM